MSVIQTIQNSHEGEKSITQSVSQIHFKQHTLLKINHPICKAAISLQGAHLLYWQPITEPTPVIWLSEKALFEKGTAIRGGIPICWPWFGNVAQPAHGFARIVDWQLKSCQENNQGVNIVLSLQDNAQTKKYWPHAFTLEAKIHLGKTCKVELACQGDFKATSALHSYFGISNISAITVTGLGEPYHEKLTTINKPTVVGEMTFNQEVDRVYTRPEAVSLIKDTDRTIKINHFNHSDVVTWNPWLERAKTTKDLTDDSYHDFVCVETCRENTPIESTANAQTSYDLIVEVIK